MTDTIDTLRARMDAAAASLDFETARRLRDRISLMAEGATAAEAEEAGEAGLLRQSPGAMGLGTGQQRVAPPPGWTPPAKPQSLTKGHKRR